MGMEFWLVYTHKIVFDEVLIHWDVYISLKYLRKDG